MQLWLNHPRCVRLGVINLRGHGQDKENGDLDPEELDHTEDVSESFGSDEDKVMAMEQPQTGKNKT